MSKSKLVETNIYRVLKPCSNCPFTDDGKKLNLNRERVSELKEMLLNDGNFVCHKTAYNLDVDMEKSDCKQERKMCAGAYEFLKKENKLNEPMRLALRLGIETF
jgi:hypothetical protein